MAELVNLKIQLQGHQKQIEIDEQDLKNQLTVKKRILAGFGYEQSDAKHLILNFAHLYESQPDDLTVPVFHDSDYHFIIDYIFEFKRPFHILAIISDGYQLRIRQKRKLGYCQVEFDDNGSEIQGEEGKNPNIPRDDLKYRGQETVRCAFCSKTNKDTQTLRICGGIYGPFSKNKFTHLNCALWCLEVYLDKEGNFMEQINGNKGQKMNKIFDEMKEKKCCYCPRKGAGLKCKNEKCNNRMHYFCAKEDNRCAMNWSNFLHLCHKCKKNQKLVEELLDKKNYDIEQRYLTEKMMKMEIQEMENPQEMVKYEEMEIQN